MAEITPALAEGLRREQVMLLCRVMSKAPIVNVIVVSFICYIIWEHVPVWSVLAWAGAVATSEVVRMIYARRSLASPPADAGRALANLVRIAFFVGCARGSAMPLFFEALPPVAEAALSVTFLGFCAGGLSTHGAYARAFYYFAGPMLLAMGIAWVGSGTKEGVVLAILFGVFALMISVFAKEIEKLVRDSFFIRHQRDQLVEQLDRERQEVALARDSAEQANNAKSRFLAAASHDLRQPLHALSLFSATLSLQATTHELRELAGHIASALRSLSSLVDALLDISKLDARAITPVLQPVDVRALVERIVDEYRPDAATKGLDLRLACGAAVAHSDPVLVERMLRNLIDNAIKYTASGHVLVGVRMDGERLRVSVEDTGPGIPAAEQERVFEEFYQIGNTERDRTMGLGLGLAIVQRVGRLLGTDIELRSAVGGGSTFAFQLPPSMSAAPAGAGEVAPAETFGKLRGRAVLVIDDEPEVRIGMRRFLEAWGCRVLVCGGLAEALRLLDEHAPAVDLILADFRLRAGENGIASIAALRQRIGAVPALLVSGDTAPERLKEAEASGLPILHKPVTAESLLHAMSGLLRA